MDNQPFSEDKILDKFLLKSVKIKTSKFSTFYKQDFKQAFSLSSGSLKPINKLPTLSTAITIIMYLNKKSLIINNQ